MIKGTIHKLLLGAAALSFPAIASAAPVFTETFTRSDSTTIGNNWSEQNPGSGGAQIDSNRLEIFSNGSQDEGFSYVTQATSNFSSPWTNVLTNNPGIVTWTINMRSNDTTHDGFDSSNDGIAFVLSATGSDLTSANGYAVVWGEQDNTDPIRLVRFANGLDADTNLTTMVEATGGNGTPGNPGSNYMSIKVTYNPATDTFELFARSDGSSNFASPTGGTYTSYGTLVNTTYTGSTMTHIGLLAAYDGDGHSRLFDNLTVDVVHAPEPAAATLLAVGALALAGRRRRN